MRPHKLMMKAFGPFAKETCVDFDRMGNNIYLISGNTGSGKTTIFDGIIYALYGTASGGGRSSLGTEAFHSDYAKDGKHREEMRVELDFSNASRSFRVERRMYWGKRGNAQKAEKESVLYENETMLVHDRGKEDKDDVTKKITEILGLDADQFRRIIMLAQGEFQKFLTAKSDERGTILGKLYDNRRHQDFQMRLKAANMMLDNWDNRLTIGAEEQLKNFVCPDYVPEEEQAVLVLDHPALLGTIDKIVERMKKEDADLRHVIQEQETARGKLEEKKTKGEESNKLLDDLKDKQAALARLDEKMDEYLALKDRVRLAEAAEKVLPSENSLNQAQKDWEGILETISKLEKEKDTLEKKLVELQKQYEEAEAVNTPRIKQLREAQARLQNILHFYKDLDDSLKLQKEKEKFFKKAETDLAKANESLLQKQTRQKELAEVLRRLEGAGQDRIKNAENELAKVTSREKELDDIRKSVRNAKKLEQEEKELAAKLQDAWAAESRAEAEHHNLYSDFIKGQAGILAQDLRKRLQEEAAVPCPVCGTLHTSADESAFATWQEGTPTEEDVEKARAVSNAAREAREAVSNNHSAKKTRYENEKESLLIKSEELLMMADWELLSGKEGAAALSFAMKECKTNKAEAENQYNKAVRDKEEKEKASTEKETVDKEAESLKTVSDDALKVRQGAYTDLENAKTSVANWKKQLEGFPETESEAKSQITALDKKAAVLQQEIEKAKNDKAQCEKNQAENQGKLNTAHQQKKTQEETKTAAQDTFTSQLKKWSFADKEAYHQALSPKGVLLNQDQLAAWIAKQKANIEKYDEERKDLASKIELLTDATKDKTYIDLSSIREQIKTLANSLEEQKDIRQTLATNIQRDEQVYEKLRKIQERRAKYSQALAKVKPLSDTANGKLAFSRYVLSGFFDRIIDQANEHLDKMTDGEYLLVRNDGGDKRTNLGLDLKVLNTITNLERDTATLSGGQLFEASLSLALGLSRVVQMESASNIQIDSMFIDEGFGSLDGSKLDKSIEVLHHLSEGNRQIGIISHVTRLDECLPKKIKVIAGERGSTVKIETDE